MSVNVTVPVEMSPVERMLYEHSCTPLYAPSVDTLFTRHSFPTPEDDFADALASYSILEALQGHVSVPEKTRCGRWILCASSKVVKKIATSTWSSVDATVRYIVGLLPAHTSCRQRILFELALRWIIVRETERTGAYPYIAYAWNYSLDSPVIGRALKFAGFRCNPFPEDRSFFVALSSYSSSVSVKVYGEMTPSVINLAFCPGAAPVFAPSWCRSSVRAKHCK